MRAGLGSLPLPRNDYEIVVPENEGVEEGGEGTMEVVEDQADVDAAAIARLKAQRKCDRGF